MVNKNNKIGWVIVLFILIVLMCNWPTNEPPTIVADDKSKACQACVQEANKHLTNEERKKFYEDEGIFYTYETNGIYSNHYFVGINIMTPFTTHVHCYVEPGTHRVVYLEINYKEPRVIVDEMGMEQKREKEWNEYLDKLHKYLDEKKKEE